MKKIILSGQPTGGGGAIAPTAPPLDPPCIAYSIALYMCVCVWLNERNVMSRNVM